jgi:hypothetical protein
MIKRPPTAIEFAFSAYWAPIQLELIIGSGERLTVGIVVVDRDGQATVHQAIPAKTFTCLHGKYGKQLAVLASDAMESAQEFARRTRLDGHWSAPFQGAFLGDLREAEGNTLDDLVSDALRMSSSIAASQSTTEVATSADDSADPERDVDEVMALTRNIVIETMPLAENLFTQQVNVGNDPLNHEVFFVGEKTVIQMAWIKPSRQLQHYLKASRSDLWSLHYLRAHSHLRNRPHFELLLGHPVNINRHTPAQVRDYKNALAQLEKEGDDKELRLIPFTTPHEAAQRLLALEYGIQR